MGNHPVEERRSRPRVSVPFPARMRGVDSNGQAFKQDVVLDNISPGGLYLRLARSIRPGTRVSVAVRLSAAPASKVSALRLVARGVVLRAEPQPDGTCGIAVAFTRRRIL
jgi:hypothetical protein